VILLCVIATSTTDLSKIVVKAIIGGLRRWWENVPHPASLTSIATRMCEMHIGKRAQPKRGVSEVGIELGQTPSSQEILQTDPTRLLNGIDKLISSLYYFC
jgi:hypothetical protein